MSTVSKLLASGEQYFDGPCFLRSAEIKTGRKTRLAGTLADAKAEVPFVCWHPEIATGIVSGDVVIVRGSLGSFSGEPQVTLNGIRLARPSDDVDVEALVPTAKVPPEESWGRITRTMEALEGAVAVTCWEIFRDRYGERFMVHPAATSFHHAYRGGLAAHTATMLDLAEAAIHVYDAEAERLDEEVVLLAILFHDAGKLAEIPCLPGAYTAAELEGHVAISLRMWHETLTEAECNHGPDEIVAARRLRLAVAHCILSHHGERAKGAPVEPATPEAILVSHVDSLDASLQGLWDALQAVEGDGPVWSRQRGNVYRRAPALDPLALAAQAPDGAVIRGEDPVPSRVRNADTRKKLRAATVFTANATRRRSEGSRCSEPTEENSDVQADE